MSLSFWAHFSVVVLIIWNISLLAGVERNHKKTAPRTVALVFITLCIIGLVVIWKALP